MNITHKRAAEILAHWNLGSAPVSDIYYEGTGVRNEHALYVGDAYVLKFTTNLGKTDITTLYAANRESIENFFVDLEAKFAEIRESLEAGN